MAVPSESGSRTERNAIKLSINDSLEQNSTESYSLVPRHSEYLFHKPTGYTPKATAKPKKIIKARLPSQANIEMALTARSKFEPKVHRIVS